jgi:hypothetical protein
VAIYYEHPDGTVEPKKRGALQISSKHFVNCDDMVDVARVVKGFYGGLEHLKESELSFQEGEHFIAELEDFLEHLRGSNRTSPVQVFCRAPVGPVADTTPWKRNVDERYREFAPSSMNAKNVRRVQLPQGSELGPLYKCGRPADAAGLEAPLMHPVFGTFVQNLRNASLPTREDYAFVREFCQKSSEFYDYELDRQTALASLLGPYLKRTMSWAQLLWISFSRDRGTMHNSVIMPNPAAIHQRFLHHATARCFSSHKLPKQQTTSFWSQGILGMNGTEFEP